MKRQMYIFEKQIINMKIPTYVSIVLITYIGFGCRNSDGDGKDSETGAIEKMFSKPDPKEIVPGKIWFLASVKYEGNRLLSQSEKDGVKYLNENFLGITQYSFYTDGDLLIGAQIYPYRFFKNDENKYYLELGQGGFSGDPVTYEVTQCTDDTIILHIIKGNTFSELGYFDQNTVIHGMDLTLELTNSGKKPV